MANGRDAAGRYVKGHKSTGGRKSRVAERALLERFKELVSDDDLAEITEALVARAKTSDTSARLLFNYLFGLPRQAIEVDADVRTNIQYLEALERVTRSVDQDSESSGLSE